MTSFPLRIGLLLFVAGGCGDGPEAGEPVDIDVVTMEREDVQAAGSDTEVVQRLAEYEQLDRVIYDAPVDLARPAGVTQWPSPRTPEDTAATGPASARADTTRVDH